MGTRFQSDLFPDPSPPCQIKLRCYFHYNSMPFPLVHNAANPEYSSVISFHLMRKKKASCLFPDSAESTSGVDGGRSARPAEHIVRVGVVECVSRSSVCLAQLDKLRLWFATPLGGAELTKIWDSECLRLLAEMVVCRVVARCSVSMTKRTLPGLPP